MRWVAPHTEQLYSITIRDSEWVVRFAPRWKVFRRFKVLSEDHARQVFHVLGQYKACEECEGTLVKADRPVCEECRLLKLAGQAPANLTECPVCYEHILDVLENRVALICSHDLCRKCAERLSVRTENYMWDPINGTFRVHTIKCPMCRHVSNITANFVPVTYPDLFAYLGIS